MNIYHFLRAKWRTHRRLREVTLIRLAATPRQVEAGRPIWHGDIVRRLSWLTDLREPRKGW